MELFHYDELIAGSFHSDPILVYEHVRANKN